MNRRRLRALWITVHNTWWPEQKSKKEKEKEMGV
jgi:hypothetical protein